MPMALYQIRNEYGLAERELYKSADKNDPEALLEGVAMAGLAGVLRQLGDLSTFAAEIFHNLHEQVMATAARGHRVMLRVQELEAEFPSIGKAFLAQTSHSRLSYTTKQCDWHANLELDQNLITQGDMPRFIVNSYEECRGPPQLFMLDKFDTAGAGACLKRYSDPSFFKTNLVSSGMVEEEIRREKEACKLKKKGLHWRNDETLESFFVLRDSNSQPNMSDQVCEKIPTKQVKLKYRHMNIPDTGRNYMEKVFEVHSTKQERLLENSISHSHTKMSVDSSESVSEVHEIVVDCSAKSPLLKARSLTQSPAKQEETELSTKSKKDRREGAELSETVPDMIVATRNTCLNISIAKIDEVSSKVESIRSTNGYRSGEAEESPSALQKMDQMELLRDDDCKSGGEPDGYRSDDVSSERENYMDALNSLGSEVETDNESRAKSDTGSINVQYQGMDSHYNKGKQQLQAHFSEPDDVESSPASLGLKNLLRNSLSSISDLDTFDNLVVCAVPQGNSIACDLQVNPEVYLSERNDESSEGLFNDCKGVEPKSVVVVISETNDKPSEGLLGDGEELELKSSDPVLCNRTSDARKSAASYLSSKTGEFFSNSCVTDLALSLNLLFHQGSSDETQAVDATTNEILSDFVEGAHVVAEHSYADQSCTADMSDLPHPAKDEMRLPRLEGNSEMSSVAYADMRSLGDVTGTPEGPSHLPQTQDANNLEEVPVHYAEDSSFSSPVPDGEPEESVKQDTEVTSRGCTSPIMTPSGAHHSSIVVQPDCLVVEMENVVAPMEDLEKFRSVTGFENADDCVENKTSVSKVPPPESKHYSDTLEPQEHCNIVLSALIPQSAEEESFPSVLLLESETSNKIDGLNPIGDNLKQSYESMVVDPIEDGMQIGLTQFDDLSPEEVSEHDPCPIYAPEHENGFHIHSLEEFVPCKAALNHHNLEEDETPGLKDDVELDFESIWNMPLSTEKDDQVASAPKSSISESLVQDLYNPYDDKFLENICSLPSEHAHEDYPHSDKGNHYTDSDKENEVLSLLRKKKIDLKTSLQYAHGNGQEYMASSTHLLTEYSNPFEKASDIRAGSEPEFNSPWEDGEDHEHLLPSYLPERAQSTGETSLLNDSLDLTFKASEPEPHDFVSSGTTSALDTPPYSHLMPEVPVSFENTSGASASSLASTMVPQSPSYQDFCLASFGTTSGQISEPSVREPVSSSPIRDLKETPPLPPLPPLEWRTGKIRLGSLPSDGNVKVLPIEQLSTTDKKHPHSSLTPRDETAQPADLSTSLPELEENVQPNFVSERKMVQPLRLSELPPIVEDKRHPNGIIFSERESVHPFHPPPVESPIEDDKHLYAPIALEGCMLHPSNPFVLLHEQSMESTHLSALLQSSDNGTSLLGQVQPDLESNRSQHGFPGLERDDLLHLNPYSVIDVKQNYGVYGGEKMQPSNMTVPLPTTGPMIIPHGFAPFVGQNLFSPYDIIDPTAEDEKPFRRHGSLLNQPRSPLMEVVSSPDKNKLRKISEMVQPPIRPKEGESDTLLEQIRKKSVELKPAVVTKPSIMGPPTNLKFAAILEKADAIRHAFVVSSENDDDGDGWSDS